MIIGKVMGSVSVPVLVTKKWVGGGGEIRAGRIEGRDRVGRDRRRMEGGRRKEGAGEWGVVGVGQEEG